MNASADRPLAQKIGSVNKCPSCGAPLKAFAAVCELCGHELVNVSANATIAALAEKFEEIERDADLKGLVQRSREESVTRRRAQVIRDFPIPNSREDLQQLLHYIQPKIAASVKPDPNAEEWRVKFHEVLSRAKKAYVDDSKMLAELDHLERAVSPTIGGSLKMSARRSPVVALIALVCVIGAVVVGLMARADRLKVEECASTYDRQASAEQSRLEQLVRQVDEEFKAGSFAQAQLHVATLHWGTVAACRQSEAATARRLWDEKRTALQTLIQQGADEAAATRHAAEDKVAAAEQLAREQTDAAQREQLEQQRVQEARVAEQRHAAAAKSAATTRSAAVDQVY